MLRKMFWVVALQIPQHHIIAIITQRAKRGDGKHADSYLIVSIGMSYAIRENYIPTNKTEVTITSRFKVEK